MRLEGKIAIVTGAASGIGLATAALFVAEGANVIAADLGMPELEGTIGVAADAGDEAAVRGLGRASVRRNSAASTSSSPMPAFPAGSPRSSSRAPEDWAGNPAGQPDRPVPGDQICRAAHEGARRRIDHLHRQRRRHSLRRRRAGLFGVEGGRHQPGQGRRDPARGRQHPRQRHLPRPDRDRHDQGHLRHGARPSGQEEQHRPAQSAEARRRARRDRPRRAVPGVRRIQLRQRPRPGRRRRPVASATPSTSKPTAARPSDRRATWPTSPTSPHHQPDFDPQARRRADRPVEQPAGERARRGGAAGAGRGDRGGRGRRQRQGGGHRLRGPDLLRRRRHHRVRQAAGACRGCRRSSTRSRIAPSRWSRRSTAPRSAAGSRSRSAAITASPCRRRSSARPRSSSACCRARAGRSGCRASPASSKALEMCATGNPIGAKEALRLRPRRPADRGRADPARGRLCRGSARRPPAAEDQSSGRTRSTSAIRRCSTNSARRMRSKFRGFDAPRSEHRGGQGRVREALCRRRASKSASCSWS